MPFGFPPESMFTFTGIPRQHLRFTLLPLKGWRLNLLERRLVESHKTIIIPFDDCVIFVSLLNCTEFSSRLSEVAQTLDAISGIQFLVGGRGLGERRPLGTV
jgi:hypothetical protein